MNISYLNPVRSDEVTAVHVSTGALPLLVFRTVYITFMPATFGVQCLVFPTMNKKPTRCTLVLKSLKLYCILIQLYMFRELLRPSSGAS
jgi:hypothetical protein